MKLRYGVSDKPKGAKLILLAFQQLLAILTGTIAVPMIAGHGLSPSAAMFGAGLGTIVYFFITKRKSPVFLGSSFSFIGSIFAAFAGGVSVQLGMLGLIIGAVSAGTVYIILSFIVKIAGTGWINKLMPPVVIGPVVAVIGLALSGNAVKDIQNGGLLIADKQGELVSASSPYIALLCGLITFAVTVVCSVHGNRGLKLIPVLVGIAAGYLSALIFTVIGNIADITAFKIIDLSIFSKILLPHGKVDINTFVGVPDFVLLKALDGTKEIHPGYVMTIITAFVPVAFVGFAEHIADHKNLSAIIESDLLEDPGLDRTLLGDGLGSIAGALSGGCPNTTYGESIACVALTGNASSVSIFAASVGCMIMSFISPFVAFIRSVPDCVMGGVCIALYGYIAVSGFKMIKHIDLDDNNNIFILSVILVTGIGGLTINFGTVTITGVATSLILGVLTNLLVSHKKQQ